MRRPASRRSGRRVTQSTRRGFSINAKLKNTEGSKMRKHLGAMAFGIAALSGKMQNPFNGIRRRRHCRSARKSVCLPAIRHNPAPPPCACNCPPRRPFSRSLAPVRSTYITSIRPTTRATTRAIRATSNRSKTRRTTTYPFNRYRIHYQRKVSAHAIQA